VIESRALAPLRREFFRRDPRQVAPELIGTILAGPDGRAGRVVEVEAYCGADDAAAHTYRGQTRRNATMFGPPGYMYVYFTYGMHWCANAVCGEEGVGVGVLIRALEPIAGLERMRLERPKAVRDTQLCSGPARLAQAMGITGASDGADLVSGEGGYRLWSDPVALPVDVLNTSRIGISKAVDAPWRWHVAGNPHVSRR
jgi:DNA-3-methyladenine glycosylase